MAAAVRASEAAATATTMVAVMAWEAAAMDAGALVRVQAASVGAKAVPWVADGTAAIEPVGPWWGLEVSVGAVEGDMESAADSAATAAKALVSTAAVALPRVRAVEVALPVPVVVTGSRPPLVVVITAVAAVRSSLPQALVATAAEAVATAAVAMATAAVAMATPAEAVATAAVAVATAAVAMATPAEAVATAAEAVATAVEAVATAAEAVATA